MNNTPQKGWILEPGSKIWRPPTTGEKIQHAISDVVQPVVYGILGLIGRLFRR